MTIMTQAMLDRRTLLASSVAAIAATLALEEKALAAGRVAGSAAFDFLMGSWDVRHRKLRERLQGSTDWIEFPGTLDVSPILSGLGNIDENVLSDPTGAYLASSVRVFIPQSASWSIYWIDGRSGDISIPVTGTFESKVGRFYSDDTFEGRPIRVRFTYEDLEPGRARWDQAFSADGGQSWETNWTMDFTRSRRNAR